MPAYEVDFQTIAVNKTIVLFDKEPKNLTAAITERLSQNRFETRVQVKEIRILEDREYEVMYEDEEDTTEEYSQTKIEDTGFTCEIIE
jgi:hypothetical protein